MQFTFDRVVRIIFSALCIAAAIWLLDILKGVLLPFAVACLIAYLLEPCVKWNMSLFRLHRRFIPVVLTLLEAAAIMTVLAWILVPYIVSETSEMASILSEYAKRQVSIPFFADGVHSFIRENIDFDFLSRLLTREEWIQLGKKTLISSWSFLSSGLDLLAGILSWLVTLLYVFFIMLDYGHIMTGFKKLVPRRNSRLVFRVARDLKKAMNRYFRGQFLIAAIVGILFAGGFLIIGLPMAVPLGIFIGLLNLVPYLQLFSIPVTVFLCMVSVAGGNNDFWLMFWESMAVYVVVQCIQDLVLTPKIMGKAMGLNPAIILLSLSVWGSLLGFMGLIIALPLTTLLISYYDLYVVKRDYLKRLNKNTGSQ